MRKKNLALHWEGILSFFIIRYGGFGGVVPCCTKTRQDKGGGDKDF